MSFCDGTGPVSFQQHQQIIHLILELPALVGFIYLHSGFQLLKNESLICDILIVQQSFLLAREGLMGYDPQMAGVEHQCIACNAGGWLIGFAETAVDDDELTAALDGTFSLTNLYRDMAIDDMAVLAPQAELPQQHIANGGIVVCRILSYCPAFDPDSSQR